MRGKTVVITGGTSGIGEVAAEKLAQMGARIVLVARNRSRGEGALQRLRKKAPGPAHTVHYADLTRISEMKRVAAEIAKAEPRIDVLVNNAGAMFATSKLTEDGLECTFALNHMAYFVVTQGLRERLVASEPARVVSTASAAHQGASLEFDDLQLTESFLPRSGYGSGMKSNGLPLIQSNRDFPAMPISSLISKPLTES
jgi:NAD(P)-dependent dehydrogenase (short-subunit alcohol dehydrogenase family)